MVPLIIITTVCIGILSRHTGQEDTLSGRLAPIGKRGVLE